MTTNDLIKSFIGLNTEQKKNVILQLNQEGYSKRDLENLIWLADMSNDTMKEQLFNELAPRIFANED